MTKNGTVKKVVELLNLRPSLRLPACLHVHLITSVISFNINSVLFYRLNFKLSFIHLTISIKLKNRPKRRIEPAEECGLIRVFKSRVLTTELSIQVRSCIQLMYVRYDAHINTGSIAIIITL